jgi:hypothetical protein
MASQAETNLAIGKEKKEAGDQAFRHGDIKQGPSSLLYQSIEVAKAQIALLSYHQVCLPALETCQRTHLITPTHPI